MVNRPKPQVVALFVPTRIFGGQRLYPTRQFLRWFYSLSPEELSQYQDFDKVNALGLLTSPSRRIRRGREVLEKYHFLVKLFAYPYRTNIILPKHSWLYTQQQMSVSRAETDTNPYSTSFYFRYHVALNLLLAKSFLQVECNEEKPPYSLFDPHTTTTDPNQWFLTNGAHKHFTCNQLRAYAGLQPMDSDFLLTYEQQVNYGGGNHE